MHCTSSPYHKQSNGLVEAAVKSTKTLQKKTSNSGRDIRMNFLNYRNTPTEGMDSSPVQRMMSKRTITTLPLAHLLEPNVQEEVWEKLISKRRKAKKYFDRGTKELPELRIGQPVRMISPPNGIGKKWKRGICIGKVSPRSYLVDIDGSIYRRIRKFLRSAKDGNTAVAPELLSSDLPSVLEHPQLSVDPSNLDPDMIPVQPTQQPFLLTEPPPSESSSA